MHESLICGRRFRTFNVVDDFNRKVLSIEIDLNLPAQLIALVLGRIAANRGYPVMLRMYNGPEFISLMLAEWQRSMPQSWNLSGRDLKKCVELKRVCLRYAYKSAMNYY